MFSAWDFNSWFFSIGAVLFMLSFLTGFSALASVLMSRIWEDACDDAVTVRLYRTAKERPIR
ncbi:MAG TPA: hypothetical protein VJT11_11455 [Nitrospiraceae bacterium]|jgi:hypothetical protein|nr:hypothetical protein [Nitrospiraceae bacterium]